MVRVAKGIWEAIRVSARTLAHSANRAVRDVEDAIIEMLTNADDRYQQLIRSGKQQVDIELIDGKTLRVRDFADGMTSDRMRSVIGEMGGRVSGMEIGAIVRGGNSKGAKDIANLGRVTYESIAADGKLHKCQLNEKFQFREFPEKPVTAKERSRLGIPTGTGTLVTIELKTKRKYSSLKKKIKKLRVLESIINDPKRIVTISDGKRPPITLKVVRPKSKLRLNETFIIPGYAGKAKFKIYRSPDPFPQERQWRFRSGQIAVMGLHGTHQVTMFCPDLEKDPAGSRLWGTLRAPLIDQLYKQWDDNFENDIEHPEHNPIPILDLDRKGLAKAHPCIKALYEEAEKRLRRIVDEERKSQQGRENEVLTENNKAVLDKVAQRMTDLFEPDRPTGRPLTKPYVLNPPFTTMVVGQTIRGSLRINTVLRPGLTAGDEVLLRPVTPDLVLDRKKVPLVASATDPKILEAEWKITANSAVPTTGVEVSFGNTTDSSTIEILLSEADKYKNLKDLKFNKKTLNIRAEKKGGRVKLFAPLALVRSEGLRPALTLADKGGFKIVGQTQLKRNKKLGIAIVEFSVRKNAINPSPTTLIAKLGRSIAIMDVRESPPQVGRFEIQVKDCSFGNQRERWNGPILQIAARHPSLSGYLGDAASQFPGQTEPHFLVLLAEIAANAVAHRELERCMDESPEQYEDADWQENISEFQDLFSKYNTSAHEVIKSSVLP